jgi:hypothetical protein
MLISAGLMRFLLGLSVAGMALLAILYLRQRRMPFDEFLAWGLLAIIVPVFGPFWVIYRHPGRPVWSYRYRVAGMQKIMARQHRRTPWRWLKKWVT